MHSFRTLYILWCIHSFMYSVMHWCDHSFAHVYTSIHCVCISLFNLANWLVGSWIDSSIHLSIDSFVHPFTHAFMTLMYQFIHLHDPDESSGQLRAPFIEFLYIWIVYGYHWLPKAYLHMYLLMCRSEPQIKQMYIKPIPITSHMRWGGGAGGWVGVGVRHMWKGMGRGFTWICGDFGVGPGDKNIWNDLFEKNVNFQNSFAYFVSPARARIGPFGRKLDSSIHSSSHSMSLSQVPLPDPRSVVGGQVIVGRSRASVQLCNVSKPLLRIQPL